MASAVLIIGATRGLGASLVRLYAAQEGTTVYGTARSHTAPSGFPQQVRWLTGVDLTMAEVGEKLTSQLKGVTELSAVIISAGYFATEELGRGKGASWAEEQRMYTTSSIAPVFLVQALQREGLLGEGTRVVLVSSEAGSVALRHGVEGGGNYGHHASKAALNMVGKLLSLDLKAQGVVVSIVHPGFMRTEMTRGVGFDRFWDEGGAVTPDEAAESLAAWTDRVDMSKTGEFWAPRGPGDIGTAEVVLGKGLATPLHLPW